MLAPPPSPPARRALALIVLVALVALVAACAGDGEHGGAEIGGGHVHGLGVNPADGALYIATHDGLFRMPAGAARATRVGESRQDTMGFAVVGPDRFIGSGHPDPGDDLPAHLGLIASSDAGRTWEPVSLLGQADFHALHADGDRVLGYDAIGGRLMRSDDGGREWEALAAPAPLYDVAAQPGSPRRLVISGPPGLLASSDGGRSWSAVPGVPGLLAWPAAGALYSLGADGAIAVSADGARSWRAAGTLLGEPVALTAAGRERLIAALHDGRIVSSADGGRSWTAGAWAGAEG